METIEAIRVTEIVRTGEYDSLLAHFKYDSSKLIHYKCRFGTLLHLCTSFGSSNLLNSLLTLGMNPNEQNEDGNTPLHIASRLGREEMLDILLKARNIDDSILNNEGKNALDVAKNKQIFMTIEYARKLHISKTVKDIFDAVHAGDLNQLKSTFSIHRNRELVDVNSQDSTGNTILHIASKRDAIELVSFCLEIGVDPFAKNEKGKVALELAKDEKIRNLLKEAPMIRSKELPLGKAVRIEGILQKWTNYASGYKKRWFVLEDGILSYYRSQADYPVSCRGSINMKYAKVWMDGTDKLRFDIIGDGSSLRYHLKAEQQADAKRWFVALSQAKQAMEVSVPTKEQQITKTFSKMSIEGVSYDEFAQNMLQTCIANVDLSESLNRSIRDFLIEIKEEKAAKLAEEFFATASSINARIRECLFMCEEREKFWKYKLEKESQKKKLFEENLQALAIENSELERLQEPATEALSAQEEEEFFDAIELPSYTQAKPHAIEKIKFPFIASSVSGYPDAGRLRLPIKSTDIKGVNLWSILKNAIGKDLTKIPLPVNFNEPISMLQRLCEDMEYADLLDKACDQSDPLDRIKYIAAFAVSSYSSTDGRTSKPFNPLLGETFEYVSKANGYRYISEQVSHHPPISACYCESEKYIFWSEVKVKTRFWGKSFEITPLGVSHVVIKQTQEHFSWRKATTSVHNIIIGKLWLDHYGDIKVTNHKTNQSCTVTMKAAGWRGGNAKRLEGQVTNERGEKRAELFGYWNQHLSARDCFSGEETVLWEKKPPLAYAPVMYNFTEFTLQLNEITAELKERLCPTDSRLREDQRAMEDGRFEEANQMKELLENKQRTVNKQRDPNYSHSPMWFYKDFDDDSNEVQWVFKGTYWDCRDKKDWKGVPGIFLLDGSAAQSQSSLSLEDDM